LSGSEHPLTELLAPLSFEPVFEQSATRRVLGIDPGLTRCGFAVLDSSGSRSVNAVSLGVITTSPKMELPERLAILHSELLSLLNEYNPHDVAVEKVFFQVNVRTAMSVGQASGLALAAASAHGCTVGQYSPNQVKDAVTGWGGANKEQVQKMVQARLGLAAPPQPADAADAAALALCHLAVAPYTMRMAQSGVRRPG